MAVKTDAIQPSATTTLIGIRFDWLYTLAATWLIGGLYVDGWAHNHNRVDTSFFTPWHAIFYSGFAVVALVMMGKILWNVRQGLTFRQAIPAGYELALFGVFIFGFGGGFDLVWHTLFGIEKGIEALYSPSHLMLALGMALITTGPLRAAWGTGAVQRERPTLIGFLPVLISMLLFLSVLTFFTQASSPFVNTVTVEGSSRPSDANIYSVTTSTAMFFQTAILMILILMVMRRWHLPFGTLTLLLFTNALLMCSQGDQFRFIIGAAITGLVGDILIHTFKISPDRPVPFRVFAFVIPVLFWGLFMLTLEITSDFWWSTHMWTGVVLQTGVVGLFLSFLVSNRESIV